MSKDYSNAFERLVNVEYPDEEDLVGLLAYATYKRDKRDFALTEEKSDVELSHYHKKLTNGVVSQYRENALRRLEAYGERVIHAAEPEIQERTRTDAISAAKSEIIQSVKDRTSGWQSITFNVVAWLISLLITFLVAVGLGKISLNVTP